MVDKIKDTIRRYNMLRQEDVVVVAVSGGADSIALLHALYSLRKEFGITVLACHVNHNLRGEESKRDEQFVCKDQSKVKVSYFVIQKDGTDILRLHVKHDVAVDRLCFAVNEMISKMKNT